ncbi:MAG: LysR family transcriptional regulator [Candidatus Wallbacteria bacterium]|nr:LysR family transcriptional regulator [Candidatus Wallbacteria bacterium]
MKQLRLLNLDDLFLLRLLLEGGTITATAQKLGLTQPAITQRIRKIERVFERRVLQKSGRGVRLTTEGLAICNAASAAIGLLDGLGPASREAVVNLGTRPEVGLSWVWPALASLRKRYPGLAYHCVFGSGEEILRMLGTGALDAVVTSAPHAVRGFGAIELAQERYVFVAAPRLAKTVRRVEDLERHVLVEHDRSFPFQRYLAAADRARMRYRDVWFAGSTVLMTRAALEGFGVGVVPEYLAAKHLRERRLARILPALRIDSDHFRLVYRQERALGDAVEMLATALKRLRLR